MPATKDEPDVEPSLAKICKRFHKNTKNPEIFLSAQPKKEDKFKKLTKELYDISIKSQDEQQLSSNYLPELLLDSMDEEQIWQQLELRNNHMMGKFLRETSRFLSLNKEALLFKCKAEQEESENDSEEAPQTHRKKENDQTSDEDEDLAAEFQSEDENKEEISVTKKPKKYGKESVVDDEFFKLSEMEEFLKAEDEKEMLKHKGKVNRNDEQGEINYFEDEGSSEDEDEEGIKYGDFFDGEDEDDASEQQTEKQSKKRKFSEDNSEEEEETDAEMEEEVKDEHLNDKNGENSENQNSNNAFEDDDEDQDETDIPKSSFEQRQERLQQRIKQQEEIALSEKPWQLRGEIDAAVRPKNSLLEEILEFDSTTRPAPVITEETTLRLEDVIRQRIKDKVWDDVERKHKPTSTPQDLRKKLVLDQEKSKESLAQVYEKEYRNQLEKLNPKDVDEKNEEPQSHKEIRKLMRTLFMQLDALSNFHYTPKPAIPELRIITNTPAIEVEEVAPVAVSSAKLLAPEEVRDRAKGDVLGKSERDRTDKKRERRKKKLKQKLVAKAKEEKLEAKQKQGIALSSKEEKAKVTKNVMKHRNVEKMNISTVDNKVTKSSKAFFSQLQDKTSIGKDVKVKKKAQKEQISAKRLKL